MSGAPAARRRPERLLRAVVAAAVRGRRALRPARAVLRVIRPARRLAQAPLVELLHRLALQAELLDRPLHDRLLARRCVRRGEPKCENRTRRTSRAVPRTSPRGHIRAAGVPWRAPLMSTPEAVRVDRRGAVTVLSLDRPERRNALGETMWAALERAVGEVEAA